ncbi:MAG: phytanoyl-CoA dioxygenase family protein [Chitinophagaceae bacterium]
MNADFELYKKELEQKGFAIIDGVFTDNEVAAINTFIETNKESLPEAKKSKDLFSIRGLFAKLPGIKKQIFNSNIKMLIRDVFGPAYFVTKGLYFDKPSMSNWFVAYHQDLSISVSNRTNSSSYRGWTIKDGQSGVQPPVKILADIYTIRIHLDDCTAQNGALHVIPGSHKNGVYKRLENDSIKETEVICEVPKGGIMLMRPLLLHASHKSTATANRRVLHLEFSHTELPDSIHWAEKELIF